MICRKHTPTDVEYRRAAIRYGEERVFCSTAL